MSRLTFGPKPKSMEITDIATGHFVFTPVMGEKLSYEALKGAIADAGYEIEGASIVVSGTATESLQLETPAGQTFHLTAVDEELKHRLLAFEPQTNWTVQGSWEVEGGAETIVVREIHEREIEQDDGGGSG